MRVVLLLALLLGAAAPAVASEAGTLSVSPSTDLVDDQIVQVSGQGWPPDRGLLLAQCDARAVDFAGCDQTAGSFVKGHNGSFTVDLRVEREISSQRYGTVDCASSPDACIVGAFYRPGRMLTSDAISFDPEGPRPDPPLRLDIDVARDIRLSSDGGRAVVDVRITCQPGMHADFYVEIAQDHGEDDALAANGVFLRRCHGTTQLRLQVHTFEGQLVPGHAVVMAEGIGFVPDGDDFAHEFELLRVTLRH